MIMQNKVIVFWQLIVSPHMAGLAKSMTDMGWTVHYVAQQLMSEDRRSLGWEAPDLVGVCFHQAINANDVQELISNLPRHAIHICQGFRGNGYVGKVQKKLRQKGIKYWVIMETVDDSGLLGVIKRALYKQLISMHKNNLEGILASGFKTRDWLVKRGADERKVFAFAYFLPKLNPPRISTEGLDLNKSIYKFAYIGSLVKRKRVDLLLSAFSDIHGSSIELFIVGNGPLESELKEIAESNFANSIKWLGVLPMSEISGFLSTVDCLVLPSTHDGWGAVVSEALLSGARVICSDSCGSAGIALASKSGFVFKTDDTNSLQTCIEYLVELGPVSESERARTREWAEQSISSVAGAHYLDRILQRSETELVHAPWMAKTL